MARLVTRVSLRPRKRRARGGLARSETSTVATSEELECFPRRPPISGASRAPPGRNHTSLDLSDSATRLVKSFLPRGLHGHATEHSAGQRQPSSARTGDAVSETRLFRVQHDWARLIVGLLPTQSKVGVVMRTSNGAFPATEGGPGSRLAVAHTRCAVFSGSTPASSSRWLFLAYPRVSFCKHAGFRTP
jgi:hypothetical protein